MLYKLEECALIDEIILPNSHLQLRADGIVQLDMDENAYYTMKETMEYLAALKKITGGVPHLILKVPGLYASLDAQSRAYSATAEAMQYSIAEAIVIRSMAQRILGNYYLASDKPAKPSRLFNKVDEAEKWLIGMRPFV
jgi:hypothetical protein